MEVTGVVLINKKHKSILYNNVGQISITFGAKGKVYFSSALCRLADIKVGKYIHFFEGSWAFVCNEDETGFRVTVDQKNEKGGGMCFTNMALIRVFLKEQQKIKQERRLPLSYYVQKDDNKTLGGKPVMILLLDKTIRELLKK